MTSRRRLSSAVLVSALALGLVACGADEPSGPDYRLITPRRYAGAEALSTPTPGKPQVMRPADARRLRPVIAAWADEVRRGDTASATRRFALPAIVYQSSFGAVAVESQTVAQAFVDALPCGARLLRTQAAGRYIVGTFQLVDGARRDCRTPGRVQVGFVFGDRDHPRRFSEWWQVDDGPNAVRPPAERPAAPVADETTFG